MSDDVGVELLEAEDGVRCSLRGGEFLALPVRHFGGDTLRHWVKGCEALRRPLAFLQHLLSGGVVLESADDDLVDGIKALDVVRGGENGGGPARKEDRALEDDPMERVGKCRRGRRKKKEEREKRKGKKDVHEPFLLYSLGNVRLVERELVGGEGTGLVGAENVDTGERLDGGELLNDRLLLSEISCADRHDGGSDLKEEVGERERRKMGRERVREKEEGEKTYDRKTDGDTDDEEDEGVCDAEKE